MRSLRLRLSIIILIIVSLSFAISVFFISLAIDARMDTLDDKSLSGQIDDLKRHIEFNGQAFVISIPEDLKREYRVGAGQFIYIITAENGDILDRFGTRDLLRPRQAFDPSNANEPLNLFATTRDLAGEDLKFYGADQWYSPDRGKNWVNIQVAQGPLHDNVVADEIIHELLEGYAVPMIGMILALIIGVSWTISWSLRSLVRLEARANELSPGADNQKLETDNLPSEIKPVVARMNEALTRLNDAYKQQKNFTDMAAHELRSPVAIIRAQAESMNSGPDRDQLIKDIQRFEHLLAQLLQLSRSDAYALDPNKQLDLGITVSEILADIGTPLVKRGVDIQLINPKGPVMVRADRNMLEIILRNLIGNAVNASDKKTVIQCIVMENGELKVCDNGPGLPPELYEKVLERFYRRDQSRLDGTGLGLSIVKRLAEAHNAALSLGPADIGGLCVSLKFQLAV